MIEEDEPVDEAPSANPKASKPPAQLVGSGAPQVKVKANVGILGLQVGEVGTFVRDDELDALIAAGNLSTVTDG